MMKTRSQVVVEPAEDAKARRGVNNEPPSEASRKLEDEALSTTSSEEETEGESLTGSLHEDYVEDGKIQSAFSQQSTLLSSV